MRQLTGIFLGMTLMTANAHAVDIGVGVKAGTLGAGVDLSVALTQTINARISVTGVDIDDQNESLTIGDPGNTGTIDATMDFDFGASSLLFDWYVFDGTFHLTVGMLKNNGKIGFSGLLQSGTVILDGQTVDTSDIVGPISGSISAGESYEPYVGIGWGRKADNDPGLALSIELGVALLDPAASLSATVNSGGANGLTQAELDTAINAAADDISNDLSVLEAWPVISFGLNYAF